MSEKVDGKAGEAIDPCYDCIHKGQAIHPCDSCCRTYEDLREPTPYDDRLSPAPKVDKLKEALRVILDCVDFRAGNCAPRDMVAAVLPTSVIEKCRDALICNGTGKATESKGRE